MSIEQQPSSDGIYMERWERAFDTIVTPFEEFVHRQTSGSIVLGLVAICALVLANSPLAAAYIHFLHMEAGIDFAGFSFQKSIHHWINDGLMAIFFFVVGLELKREFLVGELANPKNAALPIFAALGGMIVPALVYLAFNPTGVEAKGWGIPMATDIAFAIGALALLGGKVPRALLTFMIALAIVDDLGAVLVIALFYSDTIALGPLLVSGFLFLTLLTMKYAGVRQPTPFFAVAVFLWAALLESGVHATVAGILGAFTIPVRPKYDSKRFSLYMRELMDKFDAAYLQNPNILTNTDLRAIIQTLESGVKWVQAPLQQLERKWHMPVAYFILPAFAFANAGIVIDFEHIATSLGGGVTAGVTFGLVLGKTIGIAGASYIAVKVGIARWPKDVNFSHVLGAALLGGIGFTMSIFVAELAFQGNPVRLMDAKSGILIGSIISGALGYLILRYACKTGSPPEH